MQSHSPPSPVTTLLIFRFAGWRRLWALAQMGLARPLLRGVPGLRFAKLMGSGRGIGFTLAPDWERYALLAVWEDEEDARRFIDSSPLMRRYRKGARSVSVTILRTLAAHGAWNGTNPFLPSSTARWHEGPIGVLTRATIRTSRLRAFWGEVAPVSRELAEAHGLLFSIGIGEAPLVRQATFSIWSDAEAIKAFAYRGAEHRTVIGRTRNEGWYAEELFARFAVVEQSEIFQNGSELHPDSINR